MAKLFDNPPKRKRLTRAERSEMNKSNIASIRLTKADGTVLIRDGAVVDGEVVRNRPRIEESD